MPAEHLALKGFHPCVQQWFARAFEAPTPAQHKAWPPILAGRSTLLLAPTGSGKTLSAFLAALNRMMFGPPPGKDQGCRVLYVSPLKALAVDIERNLRAPIAGIHALADAGGVAHHMPTVGIRTGDTPQVERARQRRHPPDIFITTPESLYLILTSDARSMLRAVETVIVDEIHAMVPSKRGVHLFVSLERLEALRTDAPPLQRIGLSATQRPLDEVARLLGGGVVDAQDRWVPRPVDVVDAGHKRALQVRVEVPVEDMAALGQGDPDAKRGPTAEAGPSIWPAIHPRLIELIGQHRSTMVFVNSRRLAERLAGALNDLAGHEVAQAHHGSIAKDKRAEMEDRLKRGELPAMVATSSMELGIDMGAVDLVIQIEAPPSIASGMQRIGRASHQVGAVSRGVIFPKYRGDLLASAAAVAQMQAGLVEETYYPRNALDVLAQHVVAAASVEAVSADGLFALFRASAPFAELPRTAFDGVLDLLSGRYPSDQFAELRPRITWDRITGMITARAGARHVAIINGGTIPDRGLYGVFLASGAEGPARRVGELDEEMVFESRVGDVFLLGATSWRIEEITHDRVLVIPAPGAPGRMPFWHGDRPGRPLPFGKAIGALSRKLLGMKAPAAHTLLQQSHGLDERAANNLLRYLADQKEATGEVPSDRTVVVERVKDELGDWRVCILTPFGARVHAPWCTAVHAQISATVDAHVEMLWSDDGMVFRLPDSDEPPPIETFLLDPGEVEGLLVGNLANSSLFAATFRENAARALLLPRKDPRTRQPLWAQRKRSADLLAVASRYPQFPIILETYRHVLKDVFDLPGLQEVLGGIRTRAIRVVSVDNQVPSPFAASLMFSYVANFIYDQDAPMAERRAQALSVDHAQLRELLGEAEMRELLDAEAIVLTERRLQHLDGHLPARHADGLHDLLLSLGDLSREELNARVTDVEALPQWLEQLVAARRVYVAQVAGAPRYAAAEDAGRLRDALGAVPPQGLPAAFLDVAEHAVEELVARYARTHGPFTAADLAARLGLGVAVVELALRTLAGEQRVVEGEFLPGGRTREWVDVKVLRSIKQRSLARLRKQVEPVEPVVLSRFVLEWQHVTRPRAGLDALLGVVEQLQGAPIPASVLEADVLAARVQNYSAADLDTLCAAGEIIWRGLEPLGPHDGRLALYLTDHYGLLAPPVVKVEGELAEKVRVFLGQRGAVFYADLLSHTRAFGQELLRVLWDMVWAGELTNDTLVPFRSLLRSAEGRDRRNAIRGRAFRSRRSVPAGSEGRWSLLPQPVGSATERMHALTRVLLERHGVLTREMVHAEGISGGFSAVYDVLKAMEETGRVRRGYFVAGLGATQFAVPGAEERLRGMREASEEPRTVLLAATDPALAYGVALPWPTREAGRTQRAAGAHAVVHDGALVAYSRRTEANVLTFLPESEPERTRVADAVARLLAAQVEDGPRRTMLIGAVDGADPAHSALGSHLQAQGFTRGSQGYLKRKPGPPLRQ